MPAAPAEPRRLIISLSVAEAAVAVLLAVLLCRSDLAKHASLAVQVRAADIFVLVAAEVSLGLFVFVLAFWQWRLAGRTRIRLLVTLYVTLAVAFCSFCWHDVSLRTAELNRLHAAGSTLAEVREQTAAVLLTLSALALGLLAVVVVLWLDRRAQRPPQPASPPVAESR